MDTNNSGRSDCEEPAPPGTSPPAFPNTLKPLAITKGVENAKKRLRAFSIQKKTTPLSPIVPKPIGTGTTTVLIGKLSGVKATAKIEEDPQKKLPRPPKPGAARKCVQDSYSDQQKRTLSEIEDMKRKMELVDLGIPLGLICPTSTEDKAMPTKAMPPIKSFLDPAKVDELIREAKKAKVEGREFKFDYQKILPDYDNPFQRKREDVEKDHKYDRRKGGLDKRDRKMDKHEFRRYRKDDRDKYKERSKDKSRDRTKNVKETYEKDNDVNLKDFLVCDSWSENNDKRSSSSPNHDDSGNVFVSKSPDMMDTGNKIQDKVAEKIIINISKEPSQHLKECMTKKADVISKPVIDSPDSKPHVLEKLKPVIDCFKFEIDPNDDEILDIFDESSSLEKYSQVKQKTNTFYVSPGKSSNDQSSRDMSMDGMNDDTFLESVINEIRQDDNMCDETSQDKRLVEYDESPNKDDYNSPLGRRAKERKRGSVTPELDEKMKMQKKTKSNFDRKDAVKRSNDYFETKEESSEYSDKREEVSQCSDYSDRKDIGSERSNYSDGRQSTESGYKTSDTNKSDVKFVDEFRLSVEKELDEALEKSMKRCTVESLETWSFVLKICQPLLFRHDKNKCFRETSIFPKIWYTENPKLCSCVKDRAIVYEELEMLKMGLVDRVYGCDQLADTPSGNARAWYPRSSACLAEGRVQPVAVDWEADDSQQEVVPDERARRSLTPQREDEIMLDREYQRFMEAVWPDVAEAKASETSRSTTPVREDTRRKKKNVHADRYTDDKKAKKIKLSSEGWSQESDIEEEMEKSKKNKIKSKEKSRKRKRSSSTLSSMTDSDGSSKKKRKMMKRKNYKKSKSKEAAKRRRMGKKLLKKLKEKQKQKKKSERDESDDLELEEVKRKDVKKSKKKKKQQRLKKKSQKRRRKVSSTTTDFTTTSESDSEVDTRSSKSKKRKRTEGKKKRRDKRKNSSSESHSEDLFDVNILNNIKTERLTDDEKGQQLMEFSPRIHHKPREIINVKELQNDFVGNNNIHIKKEIEDPKEVCEEVTESIEREDLTVLHVLDDTVTSLESSVAIVPLPVSPPATEDTAEKNQNKPARADTSINQLFHLLEIQDSSLLTVIPMPAVPMRVVDESNLSQCSSQESVCSVKEISSYEKDDSHLRPSSQNSNYSFNDVIASQSALYHKNIETIVDSQDKYAEGYEHEHGNYEMYEQLAMAYQSDVASLLVSRQEALGAGVVPQRIETVVRMRTRGEIKCDWRADHPPAAPPANRPSRWGLKPSEVNIVLTGGEQETPPPPPLPPSAPPAPAPQPIYRIQSLAKRVDVAADYDEAYMDMYGASDRLQYGDCFSTDAGNVPHNAPPAAVTDIASVPMPSSPLKAAAAPETRSTLDARIDQALREAALNEMAAAAAAAEEQKDLPEKGILVTAVGGVAARGSKRVSFADGYQPGQDSDLEEPPVKKRRKLRRTGCAWPCPASHPDHVPLWDALPPPPPPPGDPPRSCRQALRRAQPAEPGSILGGFMPPEPPPGLISF